MADAWNKKYVLKHKNVAVAEIQLDEATGGISAIGSVYDERHVPVGVSVKKGRLDRASLNEWWRGRAIPASRDGIKEALLELRLAATQNLLDKSLGLSLSDQYWICPAGSDTDWSRLNFFDNDFSEDVGNVLLGKGSSGEEISLMSPDNTSDGWLKKKWAIIDGKRCLVKGGSGAIQQEPYNEVLARIDETAGHSSCSLYADDSRGIPIQCVRELHYTANGAGYSLVCDADAGKTKLCVRVSALRELL